MSERAHPLTLPGIPSLAKARSTTYLIHRPHLRSLLKVHYPLLLELRLNGLPLCFLLGLQLGTCWQGTGAHGGDAGGANAGGKLQGVADETRSVPHPIHINESHLALTTAAMMAVRTG